MGKWERIKNLEKKVEKDYVEISGKSGKWMGKSRKMEKMVKCGKF